METTQNPGETEGNLQTSEPGADRVIAAIAKRDALEHVLDAWGAEPSSRPRYDVLRLERRDGESLEVLIDADTARDLGDKLTITAAKARHRSRGAGGVPVDRSVNPGDAEDKARAKKVFDLFVYEDEETDIAILAAEFRASREDVAKAHAMLDEQRAKHVRDMAKIAERHVGAANELEQLSIRHAEVLLELQSVKADRANLIAEAAERDIAGEGGHSTIDLSDPSEPAPR